MEPGTAMLISSLISGAFTAGSGILGASNKRSQASRAPKHKRKLTELAATTVPG